MLKMIDERQMQIRGKIAIHTLTFVVALLLIISFSETFDIVHVLDYVSLADLMLIICMLALTFGSLSLIWKDAYFGIVKQSAMKGVLYLFAALSIMQDALFIYDVTQADIMILSIFTIIMTNSITISLLIKRKDWM